MKGRKPKPVALRLIQGNPGGRAINKDEPIAPPEIPLPPAYLTPAALEEWQRTAPLLKDAGLLSLLDRQAFGRMCQLTARLSDAERGLAEHGMLVRSPSGYPMQSPYLGIINTTGKQLVALCSEFGLTPSSRSRVKVDDKPEIDGFQRYLDRGKAQRNPVE